MKKLSKIIGRICAGAFAASLIPYSVKRDKDTGTCEVRSLLWGLRVTPGEDKNHYTFAIPPSGLNYTPDAEAETAAEAAEAPEAENVCSQETEPPAEPG